jgi:large subunit ribosomal protein L30
MNEVSDMSGEEKKIKIQWYRSSIGCPKKHKAMVKSLGFLRLQQVVERLDNPCVRGVVAKIPHLLRIVE